MTNDKSGFGIDISRYNTSPDGKQRSTLTPSQPTILKSFLLPCAPASPGVIRIPGLPIISKKPPGSAGFAWLIMFSIPVNPRRRRWITSSGSLGEIDFSQVPLVLDLELDHGQIEKPYHPMYRRISLNHSGAHQPKAHHLLYAPAGSINSCRLSISRPWIGGWRNTAGPGLIRYTRPNMPVRRLCRLESMPGWPIRPLRVGSPSVPRLPTSWITTAGMGIKPPCWNMSIRNPNSRSFAR